MRKQLVTLVKGSIGLGIRERHPEADQSKYNQESITRWLDELPMANLGETSRRVYRRLFESNSQLIDTEIRYRILQSVEDCVEHICNSLKKHYIGQSVSLTDKQKKVADLSQAIQLELAIGYKTIIEDLLSDEKYDNNLLPIAVNHSLHYFHCVQLRSYQLYSDLPSGTWHEIHLLYQLAEQNQFHENKNSLGNKSITVLNTYKDILLLATTNPNQLRQSDVEVIANALSILREYCDIGSDPDAEYDFVANLNADAPPFHRALIKDGMKGHYRAININNIVEFLQHELKTSEKEKRKTGINDITLRHLLRAWGTMATRAFTRTEFSGSIQVSVGLAASHFLISKELFDDEEDEQQQQPTGQSLVDSLEGSLKNAHILSIDDSEQYHVPNASQPEWNTGGPAVKTENLWDAVYRKKSSLDIIDDKKPYEFMAQSSNNKTVSYDLENATILNVSPGGYCLKLEGTFQKQARTGEIIGLLELDEDSQHTWNIGNIRWMKRYTEGDLQLGIQLIAPNAEPVLAQVYKSHTAEHSYQRCLLLPALIGIGQPPTIITSTIPFAINQIIHLKEHESIFKVRLSKLVSSGHSYQQFEYEKLDMDNSGNVKKPTDTTDDNFDSVWELL